ncbi:hypothetical protein [Nocardia sp. NPDC052112]|uniref:hypothetical protein n=1 Tax=Nocardia sp. NPDC052112 TaxID=3155646 RepID=UPI00343EB0B4
MTTLDAVATKKEPVQASAEELAVAELVRMAKEQIGCPQMHPDPPINAGAAGHRDTVSYEGHGDRVSPSPVGSVQ